VCVCVCVYACVCVCVCVCVCALFERATRTSSGEDTATDILATDALKEADYLQHLQLPATHTRLSLPLHSNTHTRLSLPLNSDTSLLVKERASVAGSLPP
jgi:hypothetical protein